MNNATKLPVAAKTNIAIMAANNLPIASICSNPTTNGIICVSDARSYVRAEAGMNTKLLVVRDNASVINVANGETTGKRASHVSA